MNKTTVIGRLGADAVVRNGKNGDYITYRLAVDTYKTNGEKDTTWFFCKQNTKEDSRLVNYLKKGTQVFAEGRVSAFALEDGKPQLSLFVLNMELLGGSQQGKYNGNEVPF